MTSEAEVSFEALLSQQPALASRYQHFLNSVNGNAHVPENVLTLCRARIEQIHGLRLTALDDAVRHDLLSGNIERFSEAESAALVLAERMPYQHHQIEDAEVKRVKQALGDDGCVALLTALAFFDVQCRLQVTFTARQS